MAADNARVDAVLTEVEVIRVVIPDIRRPGAARLGKTGHLPQDSRTSIIASEG
jgi:hypothetical protein